MEDNELLELAAKAAGFTVLWVNDKSADNVFLMIEDQLNDLSGVRWDPLADDGDALRLAARLKLNIEYDAPGYVTAWNNEQVELTHMVAIKDDEMAATRRAITRAAAEIGKSL